jgi:hypothetical protein
VGDWEWGGGGGKEAQTMYTHVNRCKNDKIKGEKKKKKGSWTLKKMNNS